MGEAVSGDHSRSRAPRCASCLGSILGLPRLLRLQAPNLFYPPFLS